MGVQQPSNSDIAWLNQISNCLALTCMGVCVSLTLDCTAS